MRMKYNHDCLRCGHQWTGRTEFPDRCVNCGAVNYDTPLGADKPIGAILGHSKALNEQRVHQTKANVDPWHWRATGLSPVAGDTASVAKPARDRQANRADRDG